jgi:hypothetical protein
MVLFLTLTLVLVLRLSFIFAFVWYVIFVLRMVNTLKPRIRFLGLSLCKSTVQTAVGVVKPKTKGNFLSRARHLEVFCSIPLYTEHITALVMNLTGLLAHGHDKLSISFGGNMSRICIQFAFSLESGARSVIFPNGLRVQASGRVAMAVIRVMHTKTKRNRHSGRALSFRANGAIGSPEFN